MKTCKCKKCGGEVPVDKIKQHLRSVHYVDVSSITEDDDLFDYIIFAGEVAILSDAFFDDSPSSDGFTPEGQGGEFGGGGASADFPSETERESEPDKDEPETERESEPDNDSPSSDSSDSSE